MHYKHGFKGISKTCISTGEIKQNFRLMYCPRYLNV